MSGPELVSPHKRENYLYVSVLQSSVGRRKGMRGGEGGGGLWLRGGEGKDGLNVPMGVKAGVVTLMAAPNHPHILHE